MIGRVFLGRYEIQRLLGEGGMGKVYLARQQDLGRQVVVKVMHDHVAVDSRFRDRFQRETLLMARFHHPNAVTLYDASLNDPNGPCIVMEYVKGVNLEALLAKNGRLESPRVGRILTPLCDVLQAAHDEGIIHRDLKPANLMILDPDTPKERVKVMDFGLAKLMEDSTNRRVTDTNIDFAVGTPGYIAPEQVRGETMNHRGDIYSVGVMLYELLTGRLPFQGANSMDVLLAHATEPPPRFADIGLTDWVPPGVEAIVMQCLAKDPDDRPQSARDLADSYADAIQRAQTTMNTVTKPVRTSPSRPTPPPPSEDLVELESAPSTQSTPVIAHAQTELPSSSLFAHDPGSLPFQMEAWMPETIALMKLRGFVQDNGGEVLESTLGMVRVRLGRGRTGWLGFGRRSVIEMELRLHKINPKNENQLAIEVLFHPAQVALLADENWRNRCANIFVELRAYLMGGSML